MTIGEALGVRVGDYVVSKHTPIPHMPLRVKQVYASKDREIVRFKLGGLKASQDWVDSIAVEPPPAGHRWNTHTKRWEPAP